MAFHLLERNRTGAIDLSNVLHNAMEHIHHCKRCRTFTEDELCDICRHPEREASGLLCIVESPQDVLAIEQTLSYKGQYFVLMGHLSPIDGVGPEDIGLTELEARLGAGGIDEVILATNPTVEGEATAHYIAQLCASHSVDDVAEVLEPRSRSLLLVRVALEAKPLEEADGNLHVLLALRDGVRSADHVVHVHRGVETQSD